MSEAALVFGARGQLGSAIAERLESDGLVVTRATRSPSGSHGWVSLDGDWASRIEGRSFGRVVWAQGINASGGIREAGSDQVRDAIEANVLFVVDTLRALLEVDAIRTGAGLVIVSSIWQETSRQDKLAYSVSKSAVAGLVRSLAADLGPSLIRVNAVLPGPVEGPLTRAFMSAEQIEAFSDGSPLSRLVTAAEVAEACAFLTSARSSGITAQSLVVDGGWGAVRYV